MSGITIDLQNKVALFNPTELNATTAIYETYDAETITAWVSDHITGTAWNHEYTVKSLTKAEIADGSIETGDDAKLNSIAIINHDEGSRILTTHKGNDGEIVWIITDGLFTEHQYTTILYPSEY